MQTLEIMKTHLVKVCPTATLAEAIDLMDLFQVDSLPVVDTDGLLRGMISETDVLKSALIRHRAEPSVLLCLSARARDLVETWMVSEVVSVVDTDPVDAIAERLIELDFTRVPVVDSRGTVIGTLNRIDLIQSIFEHKLSISI